MNSFIWRGKDPKTKFGPKLYAPVYLADDGTPDFNSRLVNYVLECEKQLESEELVSDVLKANTDSYKYTQHWKQHNLIDDSGDRLGGETITKFQPNEVTKELFDKIRTNYLLFLDELKMPRTKVWIHTWGNVIRTGQNISYHTHINSEYSYLACVYYPQTTSAGLNFINQIVPEDGLSIPCKENTMLMFPSWVLHGSDVYNGEHLRVSIASDIVLEESVLANPWRPHILLDDPNTMRGL